MTGNWEERPVVPENIAGPFLRDLPIEGRFRHQGGAQAASVVFYDGGGCTVHTTNGIEEVRARRWRAKPTSVCLVACGRHVTTFEVQLPAAGAATFFRTKITLRWRVTDYERVVSHRLLSVERDLGPEILNRLQDVSGRHSVTDAQRANQEVRADINAGRWATLGADVGLSCDLFVDFGTDQVHLDQVAEQRSDLAEEGRVARRFASFSRLAGGSAGDRLGYLMASGTKDDVSGVIHMMREDEAQGRSETRDFFLRMLEQDRITSPELEAHLRRLILPGERGPDSPYAAIAQGAAPPSYRELPPPPSLPSPPPPAPDGPAQGRVWNDGAWVDEDAKRDAYQPREPEPKPYERESYEPPRREPDAYESRRREPEPYEARPYEPRPYDTQPYDAQRRDAEPRDAQPYDARPYEPDPPAAPARRERRRSGDYWDAAPDEDGDRG